MGQIKCKKKKQIAISVHEVVKGINMLIEPHP